MHPCRAGAVTRQEIRNNSEMLTIFILPILAVRDSTKVHLSFEMQLENCDECCTGEYVKSDFSGFILSIFNIKQTVLMDRATQDFFWLFAFKIYISNRGGDISSPQAYCQATSKWEIYWKV